jgi:hypothetical protein
MVNVPHFSLADSPETWVASAPLEEMPWGSIGEVFQLVRNSDGARPDQATEVRACHDPTALYLRFDCADRDAWGTHTERNAPLYEEEVVEVFLAPGTSAPTRYFELEISPRGVLFAAAIHNPTGKRADLTADLRWECPGLRWAAGMKGVGQDWWAALAIPWTTLAPLPEPLWRANFYRIERPRDGAAEFTAWSPTWTTPADFHRPEYFGVLEGTASGPRD